MYNRFGDFKESHWIGHSAKTRQDHYLMIQDADYLKAAGWKVRPETRKLAEISPP